MKKILSAIYGMAVYLIFFFLFLVTKILFFQEVKEITSNTDTVIASVVGFIGFFLILLGNFFVSKLTRKEES